MVAMTGQFFERRRVVVIACCLVVFTALGSRSEAQSIVDGPVPAPWKYADVGAVGVAGSANRSTSGCCDDWLTMRSAGPNIWGTADSFGFLYQPFVGDGWISVNVLSLGNTHTFAKAGLMLRETLDPSSPFVILDIRPTRDIEFMFRPSAGASTFFQAGSFEYMPAFLMLFRSGSTVTAYVFDGKTSSAIGHVTMPMGQNLLVGFAVSSHDASTLVTSTFRTPFLHNYAFGIPDHWSDRDIGPVGQPGGTTYDSGTYTVNGAGSDIWGTADSFHFLSHVMYGNGQLVARVTSVEDTHPFAKAGIDLRLGRGGSANDAHVILDVRPTGDIEFMTRTSASAATAYLGGAVQQPPVWLKLTRSGNTVAGFVSSDGLQWNSVGSTEPNFDEMNASDGWVSAGLIATSHDPSTLSTSTFDNLALTGPGFGSLPTPWGNVDVGDTGAAGSASWEAGTFTVRGAGADIWNAADGFQYVYQAFNGCCAPHSEYPLEHLSVTARVTSVENTSPFAKAGVMLRSGWNQDASAADVILDLRPTGDIEFMTRPSAGAPTNYVTGASAATPVWLKLVRDGTNVAGYTSTDGTTWTIVGVTTTGVSNDNQAAGIVVTSHNRGVLNTSTFDHVEVRIPE